MAITIQFRRDTAANWTAENPTLAAGEPALETDTKKEKIGDGVTSWNSLPYKNTGSGGAGTNGWTPVFAVAVDGLRRVQQVVDWTGGSGEKPVAGRYVGPPDVGFVTNIANAVDIRGEEGLPGTDANLTASTLAPLILTSGGLSSTVANGKLNLDVRKANTQVVDVRDFSWVKNPEVDQTSNIQQAIDAAAAIDGRVSIPAGITTVGTLIMPYFSPANGGTFHALELSGESHPAQFFGTAGSYQMPVSASLLRSFAPTGSCVAKFSDENTDFGGISLVHLILSNLTIRPMNPGVHGILAGKASQFTARNIQVDTGIYSVNHPLPVNNSTGIETPIIDNGALTLLRNTSVSGFVYGYACNEHTDGSAVTATACRVGAFLNSGYHAQQFRRMCIQRCERTIVIGQSSGSGPTIGRAYPRFTIDQLNIEHASDAQLTPDTLWQKTVVDLEDAGNYGRGEITYSITTGGVGQVSGDFVKNGGTGVRVREIGEAW